MAYKTSSLPDVLPNGHSQLLPFHVKETSWASGDSVCMLYTHLGLARAVEASHSARQNVEKQLNF